MTDMIMRNVKTHNMFVDLGKGLALDLECDIEIGKPFSPLSSQVPLPYPQKFKAIWDTGAQGTTIATSLAGLLKLRQTGTIRVQGVTGCKDCNKFLISLHLPTGIVIPQLEVSDCPEDIGCDVLIGMDVITMGDFAVSNLFGNTTFTFRIPSVERINFTNQLPENAVQGRFVGRKKLGRNELCPCGSGKKYKKCCGRYGSQ